MRAASTVVYNPDKKKFLLVKRSDTKEMNPGEWEFPGGFIEEGETAREAAMRELLEETGLTGEVIRSGEKGEIETRKGRLEITPFLVTVKTEQVELSREHSEYRWIETGELGSIEVVEGTEREMEAVGIELPDR